jgi:hypothetical protein
MIVPGSAHALLLSQSGYDIPYSLRFRAANSARLSRTPSSASNRKTYTLSTWVKIGLDSNSSIRQIFTGGDSSTSTSTHVYFYLDKIRWYWGGSGGPEWVTTQVFRDYSAWYHLVFAVDTTQATFDDRLKMYVNGVRVTSWSSQQTGGNTAQNSDTQINSTSAHGIGSNSVAAQYLFDGYMSEINFVDGQQLTPSSFGQTDAATGVWVPKKYSGTYGTNGFYLKFNDAATTTTIGNDSSGNGNNWTTSGISVTSGTTFDQMTDTPTLNYATWNPLDSYGSTYASNANMRYGVGTGVGYVQSRSTFQLPSSGKWYWEITFTSNGASPTAYFGIASTSESLALNTVTGGEVRSVYTIDGKSYDGTTSTTYGAAISAASVIGIAADMDNGTIKFSVGGNYANGSGSFNQTYSAGASAFTDLVSSGKKWSPWTYLVQAYADVNFGQRAFSYTPPTGFKALNTANLPTPSIKKGSLYMDATLRTGTGATASVSSLGFQPDLVWIKSRSAATDHGLYDAVRGVQKQIESNTTTGETTETTGLTAFNSNGYTVGALAQLNTNTATYVDWAWKEGATPGFDIVTYTGNGTNRTISHALGAVPKFMVVKRLDTGNGWVSYHASQNASPATGYMYLNSTAGFAAASTMWNNTAPTSSVFSVGTNSETNGNTFSFVGYLWSEIEGFSKISSYTGNGSTDGPFVWCGFRPRYILAKRTDVANDWCIADSARPAFNPAYNLRANLDVVEDTTQYNTDLLSNGFKVRNTTNGMNASGGTYIFAAFAENPFKYSRAR